MAQSKAQLSNYTLPTPFTQTGTEQQENNALKMERFPLLCGCPCCSAGGRRCPLVVVVVVSLSCGGEIAHTTVPPTPPFLGFSTSALLQPFPEKDL